MHGAAQGQVIPHRDEFTQSLGFGGRSLPPVVLIGEQPHERPSLVTRFQVVERFGGKRPATGT